MADAAPLSLAFMEKRPLAAARALAVIDPADAAAFLETAPARITAGAVRHMDPWAASAVIGEMTDVGGAAILREFDPPASAAILRLLPVRTPQILAQLPRNLRRDLELSLAYPEDTVGAHMSAAVAAVEEGDTVAGALEVLRGSPAAAGDIVLVVDEARRLAGIAPAAALLRHAPGARLGDVMDTPPASLPARARLSAVETLSEWEAFAFLPVTDRQRRVIGVLSRHALRNALAGDVPGGGRLPSITGSMINAFAASTSGLALLLADAPPVRGGTGEHGGGT